MSNGALQSSWMSPGTAETVNNRLSRPAVVHQLNTNLFGNAGHTQVISVLIEQLSDKNDYGGQPFGQRHDAAKMLRRWGVEAKAAIPALEKLLNDPDRPFREAITDALVAIDPEQFGHLKAERKID